MGRSRQGIWISIIIWQKYMKKLNGIIQSFGALNVLAVLLSIMVWFFATYISCIGKSGPSNDLCGLEIVFVPLITLPVAIIGSVGVLITSVIAFVKKTKFEKLSKFHFITSLIVLLAAIIIYKQI